MFKSSLWLAHVEGTALVKGGEDVVLNKAMNFMTVVIAAKFVKQTTPNPLKGKFCFKQTLF